MNTIRTIALAALCGMASIAVASAETNGAKIVTGNYIGPSIHCDTSAGDRQNPVASFCSTVNPLHNWSPLQIGMRGGK